jgi:hypothetical protein
VRRRFWAVLTLVLSALSIGTWGFTLLTLSNSKGSVHHLTFVESFYHAVKLFTLDIGPAAGGYVSGPNWQILVALAVAAFVVFGALVAIAGDRLRRLLSRRLLSGHVIVCGAGVHGSSLARELAADHDVILLDSDAQAAGMQSPLARHEWRLVGDAVTPDVLLAAGVRRANWLVAITGDDFVNSQIVSSVHTLTGLRDRIHVLVQVEDPSLARFLEEEPETAGASPRPGDSRVATPVVTPFSANAIAAEALLDDLQCLLPGGATAPLLSLPSGSGAHLILAGDHPLIDALVLAALRRWRVQVLRDVETHADVARRPLRVSIYGPGANDRADALRRRWRPESNLLELEAKDIDPAGDVSIEQDDWLRERNVAGHAIVACVHELDGIRLTLALSRALGGRVLMTRVTTQPASVLDERLHERTARNDRLATTEVRAVADLAGDRDAIGHVAARQRLAAALEPDIGAQAARTRATELFARRSLRIHSNPGWRVPPCERVLLSPLLSPVPVSAMVRAGLALDLEAPENLRVAGERLSANGDEHQAVVAWCEYARHVDAASPRAVRDGLLAPTGDPLADEILRMRAHTLAGTVHTPAEGILAGTTRVVILAGAAGSMTGETRSLLQPLLRRALDGFQGVLLSGGTSAGLPGLVGETARDLGLHVIGYVPTGRGEPDLYPVLRETCASEEFTVREPLAMWSDILAAGIDVDDVRVVACPGGAITHAEVLLARALGARVAWLDPAGEAQLPLEDALPFGADGVLELPADAMTLRSFIGPPEHVEPLPAVVLEQIARHIHNDYRRKQRRRKAAGDAALAPWDELLPVLQRSNLSQAGDIPNKLALVGRRATEGGGRLMLSDAQVELLSEIEHGRYNHERLADGWDMGARQVTRRVTPHLKPWGELTEEARDYDREAVRNIDGALAAIGWGVVDT